MKICLVTGANKGIGYGIVKYLSNNLTKDWIIYLTARNVQLGNAALNDFTGSPVPVHFQQLDVTDKESCLNAANYIKDKYGGLDILVNNAGIAYKMDSTALFAEQAEVTMRTNFYGLLNVCDAFFSLLRKSARVVHVSSRMSHVALGRLSKELFETFTAPMTFERLMELMQQFVETAKLNEHEKHGWPNTAYGVSKIGVTKLACIQAEQMKTGPWADKNIIINACCPGYVDTDMTSHKGHKTIEEGADTPCYLAMLPDNTEIRGEFVADREIVKWEPIEMPKL